MILWTKWATTAVASHEWEATRRPHAFLKLPIEFTRNHPTPAREVDGLTQQYHGPMLLKRSRLAASLDRVISDVPV